MGNSIHKMNDFRDVEPDVARLFSVFDALGIAHETFAHQAIFTVEEGIALNLPSQIPGQHGKSLFLKSKDDQLFLVMVAEETRLDLKALSDRLETKRFSFARQELMVEILGVTPGSATPFALMNDTQKRVQVVVDQVFQDAAHAVFHPLKNTYSTRLTSTDLFTFIRHFGYNPRVLPLA